jgi:hypothetical protein
MGGYRRDRLLSRSSKKITQGESMNNEEPREPTESLGEQAELRGVALGSQQISAADHLTRARKRNPDGELRLDGETDTLYNDGLDLDFDDEPLAGTDGEGPGGVKG